MAFAYAYLLFYFFVVGAILYKRTFKYILAFLEWRPGSIFFVPVILSILAIMPVLARGRLDLIFVLAAVIYTFVPTLLIFDVGCGIRIKKQNVLWRELLAMLCLWLPVELATTTDWLKYYLGEVTHVVGWGMPSMLGLMLFLIFRDSAGMKFRFPKRNEIRGNLIIFCLGFVAAAIILIPIALALEFMGKPLDPASVSLGRVFTSFVYIFFGVALVEEFLFRCLIQNWLMHKFGESKWILAIAALIFGLSHLNNGPHALPNWRYAIVATFAGLIYGKVFQKSSSIITSAAVHASVNTVRHNFFSKAVLSNEVSEWMGKLMAMVGVQQ